MTPQVQVKHVQIKNYKSIAAAAVDLEPFTLLVGPNAAGKSNFLDALSFVADCLRDSVSAALEARGGLQATQYVLAERPKHFAFRLRLELGGDRHAEYAFRIAGKRDWRFAVSHEECRVSGPGAESREYRVADGRFVKEVDGLRPRIEPDRLALQVLSAAEEFRPVYDALAKMRFYALSPDRMRQWSPAADRDTLRRDGANAASVLWSTKLRRDPANGTDFDRLCRFMSVLVPGAEPAVVMREGKASLRLRQSFGEDRAETLPPEDMSDGTLRILGLLLAAYQPSRATLLGIEEPEATIHPAAAGVLLDVLLDAADRSQVLVATHSPDLLDHKSLKDCQIRAVEWTGSATRICPLSEASRQVIADRLYTAGELLRMSELEPDRHAADEAAGRSDSLDEASRS